MTNDKDRELIERLALEVSREVAAEAYGCDDSELEDDMPDDEKAIMIKFGQALIARYLAERGKEAVAYVRRHPDGALTAEYIEAELIEPVRKNSGAWLPLFLVPQPAIPEGMALVPIAKCEEIVDCLIDTASMNGGWDWEAVASEFTELIAAAGVKP